MASLTKTVPGKFLVDSIHGDIHLTEKEWQIIDTPSFQRLRNIKQLQMSHLTYPNATHTRFSHSIGTLAITAKVISLALENGIKLKPTEQEEIRLAALLHDIGHYPYSHLMEGIEKVILLEEKSGSSSEKKQIAPPGKPYPEHVQLGIEIVNSQSDIKDVLGTKAKKISDIFSRSTLESTLSTLISSSLDLDRFDYLQRDSHAVGLPYGKLDINYLLNALRISSEGEVGVHERAIPAVEHFLLARYFMHRTVYYHRTTVAFEEACRQLLRRLREKDGYDIPKDGSGILDIAKTKKLATFTDAFVDSLIQKAAMDEDEVIRNLALSIQGRNPAKLLKEVLVFEDGSNKHNAGLTFRDRCYSQIKEIANTNGFPIGRFLFYEAKPISFEKIPSHYTVKEYRDLTTEKEIEQELKEEEVIKIFGDDMEKPMSLLGVDYSIIPQLAGKLFKIYRLYFVSDRSIPKSKIDELREEVKDWDRHL